MALLTVVVGLQPAAAEGPGKAYFIQKARQIVIHEIAYDGLTLDEAVIDLNEMARRIDRTIDRDLVRIGPALGKAIGEPIPFKVPPNGALFNPPPVGDPNEVLIQIRQLLRNVTLEQALDVVVRTASKPIAFQITDQGITIEARKAGQKNGARRPADLVKRKLRQIVVPELAYDELPLAVVLMDLSELARRHDPAMIGVNFVVVPARIPAEAESKEGRGPLLDAMGNPVKAPKNRTKTKDADIWDLRIRINQPMKNASLKDLLNAIVVGAAHPIRYIVEDYGIVFEVLDRKVAASLETAEYQLRIDTFVMGALGVMGPQVISDGDQAFSAVPLDESVNRLFAAAGISGFSETNMIRGVFASCNTNTGIFTVRVRKNEVAVVDQLLGLLAVYARRIVRREGTVELHDPPKVRLTLRQFHISGETREGRTFWSYPAEPVTDWYTEFNTANHDPFKREERSWKKMPELLRRGDAGDTARKSRIRFYRLPLNDSALCRIGPDQVMRLVRFAGAGRNSFHQSVVEVEVGTAGRMWIPAATTGEEAFGLKLGLLVECSPAVDRRGLTIQLNGRVLINDHHDSKDLSNEEVLRSWSIESKPYFRIYEGAFHARLASGQSLRFQHWDLERKVLLIRTLTADLLDVTGEPTNPVEFVQLDSATVDTDGLVDSNIDDTQGVPALR
jgi:hypothetical protein